MDIYLIDIQEEYMSIKEDISIYILDIWQCLPSTPLPALKLMTCAQFAAAPISPQGLQLHQLQHQGPLLQHTLTKAESIQIKPSLKGYMDGQEQHG